MKTKLTILLASLFVLGSAAQAGASCASCGTGGDKAKKTASAIGMDVVETAAGTESLSTLTAAIGAAGLTDTLKSASNITVFAPTNAAFAALPDGTLEMLLKPENKETLVTILTYHVLPVSVPSDAIAPGSVDTLEGSPVAISVSDDTVMVNEATVIQADIDTSNGVVHVIDEVILPPDLDL